MKKIISGFAILISLQATAQEKVLPSELKPFIEPGYELLDFAKGDLNGDKLQDYILILKIQGEDTKTFDNINPEPARPLLLIIRQADKKLKKIVSNNELVLCKTCGGMMGDPYQSITIKPNEFTVDFYGGSSWRWSEDLTFRYDKLKKDWFLQTHASTSFQSGDPEKTMETTVINRSEIGNISLQQYNLYYNSDSSNWKVNAVKTFFYSSPDIKSAPKKAYLVKGNEVKALKQFKNFIEVTFTNSKDEITGGFLLKKDLLLIKGQ